MARTERTVTKDVTIYRNVTEFTEARDGCNGVLSEVRMSSLRDSRLGLELEYNARSDYDFQAPCKLSVTSLHGDFCLAIHGSVDEIREFFEAGLSILPQKVG